jgi:dihydrofolate synthase/folylpolyglutamate synthase
VAHNEPAAQILAANLAQRPPARRSIAVAGFLRDKDVAAISAALAASFDTWLLCTLPGARGLDASDAQSRLDGRCRNVQRAASVLAGCDMARAQARAGDRVVVFGSFHTVGPALEALGLY